MKIVYFISCLYNSGGMERILSVKANYLVEKFGYDVTILTTSQFQKPIFYKLNSKIKVVHLDIFKTNYALSRNFLLRNLILQKNRFTHKNLVKKFLLNYNADVCITLVDGPEFYFLNSINDGSRKLAEFHFSHHIFGAPISSSVGLRKLNRKITLRRFLNSARKFETFIVLTKEDESKWTKDLDNVEVISNPITLRISEENISKLSTKNVLSVGRLVDQKGFDMLIKSWFPVAQKHPDWRLNIYGDGELKNDLVNQIKELNLTEHISILDPVPNIKDVYLKSSIYVMSSRFEGMPLVLMESMAAGLPAVSFRCPSGPTELIDDGISGYLVENNNVEELSDKLLLLIENSTNRLNFGYAAKLKSKNFEIDEIMSRWNNILIEN